MHIARLMCEPAPVLCQCLRVPGLSAVEVFVLSFVFFPFQALLFEI